MLYSQNQMALAKADNQQYPFSKVSSVTHKKEDAKTLQYNMKNLNLHSKIGSQAKIEMQQLEVGQEAGGARIMKNQHQIS